MRVILRTASAIRVIRYLVLTILSIVSFPASVRAAPVPDPVARMIATAVVSKDPVALQIVVDIAKSSHPDSATEIDQLVTRLRDGVDGNFSALVARLEAQTRAERQENFGGFSRYQGLTGEGEFGAAYTTGNTNDTTLTLNASLRYDSPVWRHQVRAGVEYHRHSGEPGTERYLAHYMTGYRVSPRAFLFGLAQFERDLHAGFTMRFTEAAGIGYGIVNSPKFLWEVTAGPAFRQADNLLSKNESYAAALMGTQLTWDIGANTTLTQDAQVYLAFGEGNTYQSTTAVTTSLIDKLAVRSSFKVVRDTSLTADFRGWDTQSRITLVYGF